MVNRNTNQSFGRFGFPFFGPVQPSFSLEVEDQEDELVIKGRFSGFKKEDLTVEVVRNGIIIRAQQTATTEEEGDEGEVRVTQSPIERFIPIHFPFTEADVTASFDQEESMLTVTVGKNDANRKYITIG